MGSGRGASVREKNITTFGAQEPRNESADGKTIDSNDSFLCQGRACNFETGAGLLRRQMLRCLESRRAVRNDSDRQVLGVVSPHLPGKIFSAI